jgi:hypothetical protein
MTTKIQIYLGPEGIKEVYEMSLQTRSINIVCLANNYSQVVGDYLDKVYSKKLYGSSLKTREILPDNEANRRYAETKDPKKNQVRFLGGEESESDMMLFDNKVALVSYNPQNPFALVISDLELVISFQNQFNTLWERLEG